MSPDGSIAPGWPVDGAAISVATASQWYPVLLAVPGGAIVTWQDTRTNGIEDIYAQRVLNDGTLGAPVVGAQATSSALGPHLSVRAADRPGAVQLNGMVLAPPLVNPARSQAALSFSLAFERPVQMNVFDLNGRLVRRILDGPITAGEHTATWNLRDETGARVPPGVYIIAIAEGPAHRVLVLHE